MQSLYMLTFSKKKTIFKLFNFVLLVSADDTMVKINTHVIYQIQYIKYVY
jgi:hypothetical protein